MIDPSLFTIPYDQELALGLMRTGHHVTLFSRSRRSEEELSASVPVTELFYHVAESWLGQRLPTRIRLGVKGLDHGWSMWKLTERLRRNPPDVIHFQWLPLPLLDRAFLGRLRQIAPLVLTVHDTNPFNGDPTASIQRRGVHQCLTQFDRLVVHTQQGEGRLERLGVPPWRVAILPHGMLADPMSAGPDPMAGPLTFLLFGKIRPYKGADILIEAFAGLPPHLRSQARLRIIGKPYMDLMPLQADAAARCVEVDFETGFVADDDIATLFGPGTVAVFPYREIEASGVLFLALAHGRPIIASRLGSFAELVRDGEHGHLVPPGDIAALTAALAHILADRGFAARSAAAVRNLAGSIPSWDEIARRTVAVYRAAASVSPAGDVVN